MKQLLGFGLFAVMGIAAALGFSPISSARAEQKQHKVAICHGTASDKNPYVLIVVDLSAVKGHFDGTAPGHGKNNHPDFYARNGSCKTSSTPPNGS